MRNGIFFGILLRWIYGLCNTPVIEKIKIVFAYRWKVCLKGLTFETICCNIQKDVCYNAFVRVSVAVVFVFYVTSIRFRNKRRKEREANKWSSAERSERRPLRYASATKEVRKEKQASGPQPSEANADHFDTLPQQTKYLHTLYGSVSKWS